MLAPYSNLKDPLLHTSQSATMTARLQLCVKGYSIDHMVPRQRQERDIDAEADDGEVAVQQPADHLESLRRPRPSVHPGRLGGDQLVSAAAAAAATHGRCASLPLTEAVHLGITRRGECILQTSIHTLHKLHTSVQQSVANICWGNELGK